MNALLRLRAFATVITILYFTGGVTGSAAFAAEGSYESPQFDYVVTWDASWTKAFEDSVTGDFDELALKRGDDYVAYQGTFSDLSPADAFNWYVELWRETFPDLRVIQAYQAPPSRIPAILTYTEGRGALIEESVTVLPLVTGESVLFVLHGRPADQPRQRLDGVSLDVLPALGTDGIPASSSSSAGQSSCELVELYPGYPGYRANLPGMLGAGDNACLNDLLALDPSFSRDREDRLNLEAARRLGVTGSFTDWTWETWLAIEAERGFLPGCYACLYANGENPLPGLPPETDLSDPRIQAGRFGERNAALRFLSERGLDLSQAYNAPTDDQLRALAGMANPGRYLTATQVVALQDEFLELWFCVDGPPCSYPDVALLMDNLFRQGGYWPPPVTSTEFDQYYLIMEGAIVLSVTGLNPLSGQALVNQIDSAFLEWRLAGPARPSFGQWLRDAGIGQ